MRHYVQKSQATAISRPRTPAQTWLVLWCLLMALAAVLTTAVWAEDTTVGADTTVTTNQSEDVFILGKDATLTVGDGGRIMGFSANGSSTSTLTFLPDVGVISDPQSYDSWTVLVKNTDSSGYTPALAENYVNTAQYTENFTFGLFAMGWGGDYAFAPGQPSGNNESGYFFDASYSTNTFYYNNIYTTATYTQPYLYCEDCENFTFYNDKVTNSGYDGGNIDWVNDSSILTPLVFTGGSQTIHNYGWIKGSYNALQIYDSSDTTIYNYANAIISIPVSGVCVGDNCDSTSPINLYNMSSNDANSADKNFTLFNWGTIGSSQYTYPAVFGWYVQNSFIGNFSGGQFLQAETNSAGSTNSYYPTLWLSHASDVDVYNESSIKNIASFMYFEYGGGIRLINRGDINLKEHIMYSNGLSCTDVSLINSGSITAATMMGLDNCSATSMNVLVNRLGGSMSNLYNYNAIIYSNTPIMSTMVNFSYISNSSDTGNMFYMPSNTGSNMINYGSITALDNAAYTWNLAGETSSPSVNNHLFNTGTLSAGTNSIYALYANYDGAFDTAFRMLNSGTIEATSTSEGANTLSIDQSYYTTILNRGNITAGYSGPIDLVEATGATVFNQGIIAAPSQSSVRGIDFYGGKQNHIINGKSGQISARNNTVYGDTAQDLAITNRGVFPGSAAYAIVYGQNIYNMAGGTIRGFENKICSEGGQECGTDSGTFEVVNYGYVSGSYADAINGTATVVAHKGGFMSMYDGADECPNYWQSPNGETITSSIGTSNNLTCTINSLPTIDLSDQSVVTQYNMSGTINQANKAYAEITNPANNTSTGLSLATTSHPLRGYRLENLGSIDQTSTNVALDLSYTDVGVVDNGPGITTDSTLTDWKIDGAWQGIGASTPLGRPSCTYMVAAASTSDQSGGACSANAATVTNSLTSDSAITSDQSSAIKAQYAARLDIINEPGGLIQSGSANGASTQAVDKTIDVYRSSGLMIENQGGTITATGQHAISAPYSEYLHIKNTTAVTQVSSGDIDGVVMGVIQAAEQAITLTRTNQDDPATDDSNNPNKLTLGFNGVAGQNLPGNTPQATVGGVEYPNGFSQTSFAAITNSGMITALSNTIRATGVQYSTIDNLNPVDFNGKPLQNEGAPVVASITATDGGTAIDASYAQYVDIVNEGTISAANSTAINLGYTDAIRVKNSGTISTTGSYALNAAGESSNVLIDNSTTGTIKADSIQAVYLQGASQAAVQNQGTITANAYGVYEVDGHFVSISNGDSSNTSSTPATIEAESAYAIYSSGEYTDIINYQNGVIQASEDTINVGDYARIDNYGSIVATDCDDGTACSTEVITGGEFTHVINEDGGVITGAVTLGDYSTYEDKNTSTTTTFVAQERVAESIAPTSLIHLTNYGTVILSGHGNVSFPANIEGERIHLQVGGGEAGRLTTLSGGSITLGHENPFSQISTTENGKISDVTFIFLEQTVLRDILAGIKNGSGNIKSFTGVDQHILPVMLEPAFSTLEAADSIFGRIVTFGNQQNVTLDGGQLRNGVEALGTNTQFNFSPTTELGKETKLVSRGAGNRLDIKYQPRAPSSQQAKLVRASSAATEPAISISTAGSTVPWAAVTNSLGHPIYYNFENACIQSTQDGCITAVNGAGLLEIRDEKLAMHTTKLAELLQSEATGWTHNVRYQDHQEQDDGHPHYNATIMSLAKRWDQGDKKWLIALDQDNTHIRDNFNVSQTTLSMGMQKPWKKHTTWHALAGLSREQTTRITQETLGTSSYDQASFHAGFVGVGVGVTKAVNSAVQVGGDLGLVHEMVASYEESRYGWDTNHLTLLKPEACARLAHQSANGIRLDHELRSFYVTMVGGDSQTFYVLGNAQTHDYRNTDTWTLQYSLGAQVAKTMRVVASAAWSNQDFTQIGLSVQMN